ncbi:MAG: hypothetical protein RLZZ584_899, partial [Pseudomonadota bacterium]
MNTTPAPCSSHDAGDGPVDPADRPNDRALGRWPDTDASPALADITQWLAALPGASVDASQTLFELLYGELRRMARSQLRREGSEHTLSATALTHELWFRMSEQSRTRWRN